MQLHAEHIINRFCVAGINHTCASAEVRGTFSVDQAIHTDILLHAKEMGLNSVFVVSTCNRTEIYGYAHHPCELAGLLTKFTKGDMASFLEHSYRYQGSLALQHLLTLLLQLLATRALAAQIVDRVAELSDLARHEARAEADGRADRSPAERAEPRTAEPAREVAPRVAIAGAAVDGGEVADFDHFDIRHFILRHDTDPF